MEILVKLPLIFSITVFNMTELVDKTLTIKIFVQIDVSTKV